MKELAMKTGAEHKVFGFVHCTTDDKKKNNVECVYSVMMT